MALNLQKTAELKNIVSSEFFVIILCLGIALKHIFATLKNRDSAMIHQYQLTTEGFRHFAKILFSQNFAYALSFNALILFQSSGLCAHPYIH